MEDDDPFLNSSWTGEECDVNSTWIFMSFGDCVINARQYVSFSVGLISLLSWMCAQIPQFVVNCRTGRADESLSFWFLLLWFFSDLANFLGTILSRQLIVLVVLGAYYIIIDGIFLLQFIFHFIRNRGLTGIKKIFSSKDSHFHVKAPKTLTVLFPCFGIIILLCHFSPQHSSQYSYSPVQWKGRILLETEEEVIIDFNDTEFIIGYTLGWIAAVVYFFALPPQIIKNFRRHSVSGLSLLTFLFATVGDSAYFLSVLLFSVEKVFIVRTLPWIAASVWSVFFEGFVVVQIIGYRCLHYHQDSKKLAAELAILKQETTV